MASPNPPSQRLPTLATAHATAPTPGDTLEEVDLNHVQNGETKAPLSLENDIMQCARLGETGLIKKLFDAGKYDAKYADEEGITPLHVRTILRRDHSQSVARFFAKSCMTVGSNQQPICNMQIPCRVRR